MKKLSFKTSSAGEINEYAKVGRIVDGYYLDVPDEVYETPEKYYYVDGEFIENPNYKPPEKLIDETNNTILDLAEMAIDHEMRLSMLELGLTE